MYVSVKLQESKIKGSRGSIQGQSCPAGQEGKTFPAARGTGALAALAA